MKRLQFPLLIGADAQYNSRTKNLEFLSPSHLSCCMLFTPTETVLRNQTVF